LFFFIDFSLKIFIRGGWRRKPTPTASDEAFRRLTTVAEACIGRKEEKKEKEEEKKKGKIKRRTRTKSRRIGKDKKKK